MQNKGYKKKRSPLIFIILVSIVVIGIILVILISNNDKDISNESQNISNSNQDISNDNQEISNYDKNSLIGTFLYDKNKTEYEFKEDGTGSMSSGDYNFDYKYQIDGNILSIDFVKDEVHDVKYSFELKDETLKLISKEGTASIGEEYILKKENK